MKIRSSSCLRGKRAGATPAHSRAGYTGRSHMEASERGAADCGDRWVNFAHRNRPISPRAADTTGSCAFSGLNCVPSAQLVVALSCSVCNRDRPFTLEEGRHPIETHILRAHTLAADKADRNGADERLWLLLLQDRKLM